MKGLEQQVFSAAHKGALVLAANKRLFRHLRASFDQQMLKNQAVVWSSPQIFAYDGWLQRCLDNLGESRRLLSPLQQRHLWEEQIVKATRGSALELMNLDKTTDTAVRAHNLLSEYGVTLDGLSLTDDQQVFLEWRKGYQHLCDEHQWLDHGALAGIIIAAYAGGHLDPPQEFMLVGFDQLPPGAVALKQTLERLGSVCLEPQPAVCEAGRVLRYAAVDERDETEMMALWVRHLLEKGVASIGVVVPDLQRRKQQIERTLRKHIDPEAALNLTETSVVTLSLGSVMADEGVIAAALACLDVGHKLTLQQVSYLLRTPFIAGGKLESDQRALLDQRLRSFQQDEFSLDSLINLVSNSGRLPVLHRFLVTLHKNSRRRSSGEEWATCFAAELKSLGWPGDVSLSSRSYQAVKAWYDKVLNGLAGVDPLALPISRSQAVRVVKQIAKALDFQPESVAGPVQIVGLLESSGLSFDSLWVMGLEETVIPALPRPNPFIPYSLQNQLQMPHAGFARELEFADQVLLRLRHAAPDIIFSYPQRAGDVDRSPSPLIQNIGIAGRPEISPAADLLALMRTDSAGIESWIDSQGPALEGKGSIGGTRLLQDQAHCPFRAFVHHRLHVRCFDQTAPGLSPVVRGNLVHLTLQGIWAELKSQRLLFQLDPQQREILIIRQTEKALATSFERYGDLYRQLLQLEQQRIVRLMTEWFEQVEVQREPFEVEATEEEHQVQIGPLQLKLKIDRIDRLSSGERIIIDYKTGADLRAVDFLTSPLIEPQLPCYAIAGDAGENHPEGIVVARVKPGACRLLGIAANEEMLAKVKSVAVLPQAADKGITDWTGLQEFWRNQLHQLAADFAAGKAIVKPFDHQKSCRYCDLPGLCRIGNTELEENTDDDC